MILRVMEKWILYSKYDLEDVWSFSRKKFASEEIYNPHGGKTMFRKIRKNVGEKSLPAEEIYESFARE